MTPPNGQRPPGEPAGVSLDHQGVGIKANSTGGTTTATRYSRPSRATIWRVRWYRAGWACGGKPTNVRYYQQETAARRYADKLAAGDPNEHGPLIVELSRAPRGHWEVVDR
jgi:hypothetical protein